MPRRYRDAPWQKRPKPAIGGSHARADSGLSWCETLQRCPPAFGSFSVRQHSRIERPGVADKTASGILPALEKSHAPSRSFRRCSCRNGCHGSAQLRRFFRCDDVRPGTGCRGRRQGAGRIAGTGLVVIAVVVAIRCPRRVWLGLRSAKHRASGESGHELLYCRLRAVGDVARRHPPRRCRGQKVADDATQSHTLRCVVKARPVLVQRTGRGPIAPGNRHPRPTTPPHRSENVLSTSAR
jgi:hypothetical protein